VQGVPTPQHTGDDGRGRREEGLALHVRRKSQGQWDTSESVLEPIFYFFSSEIFTPKLLRVMESLDK
jgi:hypothetical protein